MTARLSRCQIWVVFGGLLLGSFLGSLDQTVVPTAPPTIVRDLGTTSQLSWIVTAYLLTSTLAIGLWGKLSDILGRRPFYLVCTARQVIAGDSLAFVVQPNKMSLQVAPWPATFLVVFVAEWGDLTQLTSVALVAMTGQPLSVAIGAIAALWLVTVLVSNAGSCLGNAVTPIVLNRASAALVAGAGVFVLASAARSILSA